MKIDTFAVHQEIHKLKCRSANHKYICVGETCRQLGSEGTAGGSMAFLRRLRPQGSALCVRPQVCYWLRGP